MTEAVSEARSAHIRAVTITSIATLAGIFAGILSSVMTSDVPVEEAATDLGALAILVLAILIQIPLYRAGGYDDFGAKDVLFVVFMTFALWFITFGIILTTETTFL